MSAPLLPVKRNAPLEAELVENGPRVIDATSLEKWLKFVDASPRTLDTYNKALRRFFAAMSARGINRPTREDVIEYRDELRRTRKPATVQINLVAVKLFFKWTADEGIYENIADNLKTAKTDRAHKKDFLTPEQVGDVFAGIDKTTPTGLRDYAVVALMVTTGLRVSSVVGANIRDLRPVGDSLALYYRGKGHEEAATFVKIPRKVEKPLREYLATRGRLDGDSPLFAGASNNGRGTRLTARSLSRLVKNRLVGAGYNSDRLTAHSLRHTAATTLIRNGGTVEDAQQLLDHANIATTMIYAQLLDRAASTAEQKIADALTF